MQANFTQNSITQIGVILTDANKRIQWVNIGFTEITGYELEEVLGKNPGTILQGDETEVDVVQRMRKNLTEQISFSETITNYRKSGEKYECKLTIHPIFDASGKLSNFIAFEIDKTKVVDDAHLALLNPRLKYKGSSLHLGTENQLFKQLIHLMEVERLYLDPHLSMMKLAEKMGTNSKYLSQVVNGKTNNNFHHFLNSYRIKEVEKQLVEQQHSNLTFFGIASQCGFKNKSTFYKVFKEFKGLTPSQFLKNHKNKRGSD